MGTQGITERQLQRWVLFFDVVGGVKDLKEHTEMPCVTERRINHVPGKLLFYKTFCPDQYNVIDWNLFQNGIRNMLWPMLLRGQRLKTARNKRAKFLLILASSPEILDDVRKTPVPIYYLCSMSDQSIQTQEICNSKVNITQLCFVFLSGCNLICEAKKFLSFLCHLLDSCICNIFVRWKTFAL